MGCSDARRKAQSASIRSKLVYAAGTGTQDGPIVVRRHDRLTRIRIVSAEHGIVVGRSSSRLESLEDGCAALAGSGAHAGHGIDPNQLDARWDPERNRRLIGERELHEIPGDRRSGAARLRISAQTAGLVVAHIEADHEI